MTRPELLGGGPVTIFPSSPDPENLKKKRAIVKLEPTAGLRNGWCTVEGKKKTRAINTLAPPMGRDDAGAL